MFSSARPRDRTLRQRSKVVRRVHEVVDMGCDRRGPAAAWAHRVARHGQRDAERPRRAGLVRGAGPAPATLLGSRRPRDLVWVGLAALGIALFGAGPTKVVALGFGLALLAGACWALYIVSTAAPGRRWAGVDGLAVASTVATLASRRSQWLRRTRACSSHACWGWGLVGLLSSVIPCSLDAHFPSGSAADRVLGRELGPSRIAPRCCGRRTHPPRRQRKALDRSRC